MSDREAAAAVKPSKVAQSALYVTLLTLAAIAVGALGATAGLVAPLLGFLLFVAGLILGGPVSLVLGVIGLVVTRLRAGRPIRPGRRPALIAAAVGAALVIVMIVVVLSGGGPAIHDVTTNPADPPRFVALAAANPGRDLSYPHGRGDVRALQRTAYPDLEPIRLEVPPAEALRRARSVAESLGWNLVAVDEGGGRLEATDTSRVFRFVDDIAVRVLPEGGGSIVDLRSTSRVGESDLGANAARIRVFRARLLESSGE